MRNYYYIYIISFDNIKPNFIALKIFKLYDILLIYMIPYIFLNLIVMPMTKDSSMENIAFTFLDLVSKSIVENSILTKIFQVLYQLILICCFFITDNPTHYFSQLVLQTPYLGLITSIILTIVIVEIVLAIICNFQYELYHQLCLYRYIIFPLIVIFLVSQIYNPFYLYEAVAIILLSLITIFTLLLSRLLFQPNNIDKLWNFLYLETCFVLTDVLMALKIIAVSNVSIWVLLLVWVAIEYIVYRQNHYFDKYKSKAKLSSYINCLKQYFLCICIFRQIFLSKTQSLTLIMASWPVVLMMMTFQSCKTKEVFSGKAQISYFIEFARVISDELLKFKKFQSATFKESFLMAFISIHQNNCNNQNCPLLQPSTAEQLKDSSEPSNLKTLLQKIIKKCQNLFNIYLQNNSNSLKIRLLLLNFYTIHLPNKQKILQVMSSIQSFPFSWDQKMIFFNLNNKIKSIQSAQIIDNTRGQDQFQQFKTILRGTLICLRQFWEELLAQKVDINHLMCISTKLFPLKKQVEETWKKHLTEEKFTSWNILRTYVIYRKNILHDYMNSCILQDYCKIIEQKLKSKHQVGYMNFETERAVVTILLTDSSLGNISSVNTQTCKLFSYSDRSQIMNLRVNDIMPSVISQVHDHILATYLKDRYKRINQDQRLLFGKNKNGFIFPIYLQLRKLSWNANDELIFIANFQLPKIKSAPICCISDLEGNILDFTASFASLFLKKSKKKAAIQTKNIQQLIPSFFDVIQNIDQVIACNKFEFSQKAISNKIPSSSYISFSASQLQIKGQKIGYIIEGQQRNLIKKKSWEGKNINDLLLSKEVKQIHHNTFNPTTFSYQISSTRQTFDNKIVERQFSIPFFNKEDFKQALCIKDAQTIDFGKSIKTVRLNNNRLQQVVQQSFSSDQNNQEWRERLLLTRVQMMRQEGGLKDNKSIVYFYRFGVTLMAIVLLLFCSIMLLQVKSFQSSQLEQEKSFAFKWTIRELLPEYLIYANFPQNINYRQQMKIILKQLSQNLISANIQEQQKQIIYKIIYGSSIFIKMPLPLNILDFNYTELEQTKLINLWYIMCALGLAFQIIIICMFLYYKYTMANIYVILLSINDKKLHNFSKQVDQLIEDLALNPSEQSSTLMNKQQYTIQKEQDQFQRVKKFKTNFKRQYLQLFAQMVVPILILLAYSSFCTFFVTVNFNNYYDYSQIWKQDSQLLSQSSIVIMQSLMNFQQNSNFNLSTNFYQLAQSFERNLFQFNFDTNSDLQQLLKGNPCNQIHLLTQLGINSTSICSNQSQIFQNGLMSVLNFIMTTMANYKYQYQTHKNLTNQKTEWPLLINLQFNYIKPLLSYSGQLIKSLIQNYRLKLQKLIIILTTVQIALVILAIIYLNCYPIQAMMQKLMHTKDLISIVPVDKQFVLKDVLTNLTTQAFEKV